MNILKSFSHHSWGADFHTLHLLYHTSIRPQLDYGSIVYNSAKKSHIGILDPIQNQALRLCLGAFRTSPIISMQVEANEPPLWLRGGSLASTSKPLQKLSLQYYC